MAPWTWLHGSMGLAPWLHGLGSMAPWAWLHGPMGLAPWLHGLGSMAPWAWLHGSMGCAPWLRDVREYVLSCGCRRRKRANSQRIGMMPARFLRPWEVLEMDIQDLKQESQDGNRYLLVVVDRASKFLFAYPLPSKDAVGVSRKLLELLLTFGVPLSIRSDAGGEFTAQMVKHFCQRLKVSIDYGPSNNPVPRGRSKGWGVGSRRYCPNSASLGLGYGTDMYSLHVGSSASPQILAYLHLRHHSVYCSVEMLAHSWTLLRQSSMVWNMKEDWTLLLRTNKKPSERCAKP